MEQAVRNSLWGHGPFMRVWVGSSISQVGDQVTLLALPWLVLQITHSPFQLGLVFALQNLPFLLFTLIAGVYADRWDRKFIMLTADLVRLVVLVSVPLGAALGTLTVVQLYLVAFVTGTARVWFDVAQYALLPGILTGEQLVEGNGKFMSAEGAAVLIGPSIGGFLIKLVNAANAVLADAASFLVSALAIFTLPSLRSIEAPAEKGWLAQLGAGFRYMLRTRPIIENAIFLVLFLVFNMMVESVMVFYAQHELHLDAAQTGIMFALAGVGPILAGPLAPRIRRRFRMGQILLTVVALSGPISAYMLVAPLLPKLLAVVTVGATGAIGYGSGTLWNVLTISYRQSIIPGHLMSRVNSSLRFIAWGIIPISAFLGGLLTQTIGIRWVIALSAAGLVFVNFLPFALFSELRKL